VRFLFVVPPLTGHVNPTISVAAELTGRGHEVAWVGHPGALRRLLPADAKLYELDDRVPQSLVAALTAKAQSVRGLSGLKFLWEDFLLPLARAMAPGVDAACTDFAPAIVVADQQALAGAFVARRRGLPFATFCTTSASVVDPLAGLPKVREWLADALRALEKEHDLAPATEPDRSPSLVVVFSTLALVGGDPARFPAHYHFVGPAFTGRARSVAQARAHADFPWDALASMRRPRVLVSLGTVNQDRGDRFYAAACEAVVGAPPISTVLVAPPARVAAAPANVLVRAHVPQLDLLLEVDAVVCHAGHNTVCESLWHGLPLVVAPIKDDQPVIAQQVADAGAGVRVKFGRAGGVELRAAIDRVLAEPSFRASAAAIGASFRAAGGAASAADALERLI